MESVGAFEAKTYLSNLLERVAHGESIIITRHGTPIAKLVPFAEDQAKDLRKVVKEIHQLRATLPRIASSDLKKMIEEGRKH
jgi:prevent-host-death family protein